MSDYQEQIIADYQKLIYDIYQKEKLTSLKGLNNEFLVNGRNIVEWHAVITRKGRCKYYKSFDFIQNFDDLVLCSDEIIALLMMAFHLLEKCYIQTMKICPLIDIVCSLML